MVLGVLEGFGLASQQIFKWIDWNREVFQFDGNQRLDREALRMDMQMERFKLFREDIANLVDLTVSRMEMYHLVGALALGFCIVLFTEGRAHNDPVCLLNIYLVSTACAFIFLLLAVWLAMHASIASKSFGTRLLLRYVRLPLPTNEQVDAISSNLAAFEKQGLRNVLRVPFVQGSQWKQPNGPGIEEPSDADDKMPPFAGKSGKLKKSTADLAARQRLEESSIGRRPFLGKAETPFSDEAEVLHATGTTPGEHVDLFRRLQAKWNCFDAYARVCMSIGMNQVLQSLTYYAISLTFVSNRSPSLGVALILIFQAAAAALCVIDISEPGPVVVVIVSMANSLPAICILVVLGVAPRDPSGHLYLDDTYHGAFLIFFWYILWLELVLYMASPGTERTDGYGVGRLPRKFRATYYMDVFGDAEDPTEAHHSEIHDRSGHRDKHQRVVRQAEAAKQACEKAKAASRLWKDMPVDGMLDSQRAEIAAAAEHIRNWEEELRKQLHYANKKQMLGPATIGKAVNEEAQRYFEHGLVGPLEYHSNDYTSNYHYVVDTGEFSWEAPSGQQVITAGTVVSLAAAMEDSVRVLHAVMLSVQGAHVDSKDIQLPRNEAECNTVLPWQMVWWVTRTVQLVVLWLLIVALMAEFGYRIDHAKLSSGDRRLVARSLLQDVVFERLEVHWPHGRFFRPETLSCVAASVGGLIIGSPFQQYTAAAVGDASLSLGSIPSARFPPGAVSICPPGMEHSTELTICLVALPMPAGTGVAFWEMRSSQDSAVVLPIRGAGWQILSGAVLPCSRIKASSVAVPWENLAARWCVVLAGWDGTHLSVAAVQLAAVGSPELFGSGTVVRPRLAVPLWPQQPDAEKELRPLALHMEPTGERLWALLDNNELRAWDVLRPEHLGSWHAAWPAEAGAFQAAALCTHENHGLLAVGLSRSVGPSLLRTALPVSPGELVDDSG